MPKHARQMWYTPFLNVSQPDQWRIFSTVTQLPKQAEWRAVDRFLNAVNLLGGFIMDPRIPVRLENRIPSSRRSGNGHPWHVLQGGFFFLLTILLAMAALVHEPAGSFMEPSAPDRAHTALTNEAEPETLLTGFATDYGPALPLYETLPRVKVLSTQRNTAVSTVAQARLQPSTHTHAAPTTEVGALACAAPRYDVLRTYRL